MGKLKSSKHNNSSSASSPYAKAEKTTNNVFKFNTGLGQHILKNPGIAEAIVQKANLKPTDEVGSGTGNLTMKILEQARSCIAVELDPRMASEITKRVQGTPYQKKLEVLLGDVMKTDLPPFDVCISNTPYQISSPLVFKLLSLPNPPRTMVMMFQQEFSKRLTAQPGDPLYSRLSVNVQLFSKVSHVMKVGKNNFKPPPQVESSVVRIEPKLGAERPRVSWEEWDGMLRICFNRKNRVMRASFTTKEVLALIEKNYKTWCAMNGISFDDTIVGAVADDQMDVDEEEWGGISENDDNDHAMDGDDDTPAFFKEQAAKSAKKQTAKTKSKRNKSAGAVLVREKIRRVLEEKTDLADKRARVCDENDFMKLLLAFNEEGIHFA